MSETKDLSVVKLGQASKTSVEELRQAFKTLVPWWDGAIENILKTHTRKNVNLDSYYLFPLTEITVRNDCKDIPKFINERYQTILSAVHTSDISVAMIINGKNGKTNIYLGFMRDEGSENDPELFQSIVNGVLPGKKIKLKETVNISTLVNGCLHGGIVTGVPILKKDNEKQKFNISSVVRSLYGKNYTLAIISKPINDIAKQQSLNELIQIRDKLHTLVKRTVGEERGTGISTAKSEQSTNGTSQPVTGQWFRSTLVYSRRAPETKSENKTTGKTETESEQRSQSLSIEQQNGYALELEKVADQHIERMMQGLNSGFWETTITFVAKDKISCDILGGSFVGELSKPNDHLLPPPRLYTDALNKEQMLFLPATDSNNIIFPKSLASYVTSEELSLISSPPKESLPGYEIKKMPLLSLTDYNDEGEIKLGNIADYGNSIRGSFLSLSKKDLNKHLFVCGLTGSGKTTTVKHILKSITENENIPFLVLESAKRDYRQLLADNVFQGKLNIFTIGDATVSPIRFNPFYIQKGVHPLVHIDYLKAIFNASFSLYGPMPSIVEKCLHNIYLKKGWNLTTGKHPNFIDPKGDDDESRYSFPEHKYCFPTLSDLKDEVDNYIKNELEYKGELRDNIRTAIVVRLESLCIGAKGLMFNTYDFYPLEDLLTKSTIFEMENLADDDDKAFFCGLILVLISEYRQKENPAINPGSREKGLQHFMVIEEAHRLLKNVEIERTSEMMGNPKGKAVEVFCNVISEMRSLGQGVAVVEQIPTKISPDVIKNSNTKIVHRLVSKDDQSLLAGSLSISDDDALYLNRLNTGHALCHKEGMERPVECKIFNDVESGARSEEKIHELMAKLNIRTLHSFEAYELSTLLGDNGKEVVVKLLNSLCTIDLNSVNDLVDLAKEGLRKLLVRGNFHTCFNEEIFTDYIILQIFELLSKGIYCQEPKFPKNLKRILFETIEHPNKNNYEELMSNLKTYWKVEDIKPFIIEVVENLVFKYLIKNNADFKVADEKSVIKSFFLISDDQFVEEIFTNIIKRKGSYND